MGKSVEATRSYRFYFRDVFLYFYEPGKLRNKLCRKVRNTVYLIHCIIFLIILGDILKRFQAGIGSSARRKPSGLSFQEQLLNIQERKASIFSDKMSRYLCKKSRIHSQVSCFHNFHRFATLLFFILRFLDFATFMASHPSMTSKPFS